MYLTMSKKDDYKAGFEDGQKGFASHSSNPDYRSGWLNGKQEYDYWHDAELYPDLGDAPKKSPKNLGARLGNADDAGTSFGSIVVFLLLLTPFIAFVAFLVSLFQ